MAQKPTNSRIPGFYALSVQQRRAELSVRGQVNTTEMADTLDRGGLELALADKIVENVIGVYSLPFAVALNVRLNDVDRLVPMVVEEPSVVAAASNAARMIRAGGGFHAAMVEELMTCQIQLFGVADPSGAVKALEQARTELLAMAAAAVPRLVSRGAGPRDLEVRDLGNGMVVVHVYVDCGDAMGANLVNTIAEHLGPRVADLGQGRLGLRILTNLCDRRRVRVEGRVPFDALVGQGADPKSGKEIALGIEQASLFAEADPYRAATHNKGIMNGIDSVVIATGNDYRAVEAGAHAYAALRGRYAPLATWRCSDGWLTGTAELPLALGTVGGTLRVHPTAQFALAMADVRGAADLSQLAAATGLASNLAALRALATEGIQRGHMSLHARSVASAAGATGQEVEQVARMLVEAGEFTPEKASSCLRHLRQSAVEQ